jgi:hypothetical protein
MRQGQQNRRGRGRNRKGHHNPLTRSFESNGPDVKIRGTALHIAEKYMSLARDALASGDPVLAENYLQHAEHYNRIIMAFRDQQAQQSGEAMNGAYGRRQPPAGEAFDAEDLADDEEDDFSAESFAQPPRTPEPHLRPGDAHGRFPERQPRVEPAEQPRPMRERFGEGHRGAGGERQHHGPAEGGVAEGQSNMPSRGDQQPRRRERFAQPHEQPEFLRRPVRRPRREANGSDGAESNSSATEDAGSHEK